MKEERYVWRKLSAAKWEDVWSERLTEFSDRLAITALAGKPTVRIEVFEISHADGNRLRKVFGGTCSRQGRELPLVPAQKKPINIRGRLAILSSESERSMVNGLVRTLVVPAGMAFGTGEHATTLNCLRFLADLAAALEGKRWTALDLGCGSGILALAARRLGAQRVVAADFDPECVRITRENSRANGLRGLSVRKFDVLNWEANERFDIVCANLYSTILTAIAPKLARSVSSNGTLIFSGVMRNQEAEVVAAFRKSGLHITQTKRQGKWVASTARRRQ